MEDRITACVSPLPPAQRVIFIPQQETFRLPPPMHMIDRVCIEHCFSYANYEPTSGHFRLRAKLDTLIGDYWALLALQQESYIVRARDLPLIQVVSSPDDKTFRIIHLSEGQRVTSSGSPY
jgi:hypothetical protein